MITTSMKIQLHPLRVAGVNDMHGKLATIDIPTQIPVELHTHASLLCENYKHTVRWFLIGHPLYICNTLRESANGGKLCKRIMKAARSGVTGGYVIRDNFYPSDKLPDEAAQKYYAEATTQGSLASKETRTTNRIHISHSRLEVAA